MSKPPVPQTDENEATLPNQPFGYWLRNQTALFASQILSILGFLSFIAATFYYIHKNLEEVHFDKALAGIQYAIYIAHLIILAIFIGWLISIIDNNKVGNFRVNLAYETIFKSNPPNNLLSKSKRQLREFKVYFLWFWIVMFCLYLIFTFGTFYSKPENNFYLSKIIFPFLQIAFNNLGSLFIYCCLTVLFSSSDKWKKSKIRQKVHIYFCSIIILILTLSFWFFLFLCNNQQGIIDEKILLAYIAIFEAISGMLNAVVLALLIARLDSKLIGLHSFLIAVLYVYSAVQPLFVAFEQSASPFPVIKTFVLIFVFIFKIHFFLIITYTLQTGRMLNFLFCFPTLSKRVNSIFANQFEIEIYKKEENNFKFRIKEENKIIYKSDLVFNRREECYRRVKELRELVREEKAIFDIQLKIDGGYSLEIKEGGDKICHNMNLTSKEDAEDLKRRSVKKIPYCKITHS
jgi:uncharacterized protein YegP (UPF0339 family)